MVFLVSELVEAGSALSQCVPWVSCDSLRSVRPDTEVDGD